MSLSQTNLRDTYFQYPTLTKITGDPTYTSLTLLDKEIKSNGLSVRSHLGGGLHGHLGLVSTAAAYELVAPGTPFVRPDLPVLPILQNATGH